MSFTCQKVKHNHNQQYHYTQKTPHLLKYTYWQSDINVNDNVHNLWMTSNLVPWNFIKLITIWHETNTFLSHQQEIYTYLQALKKKVNTGQKQKHWENDNCRHINQTYTRLACKRETEKQKFSDTCCWCGLWLCISYSKEFRLILLRMVTEAQELPYSTLFPWSYIILSKKMQHWRNVSPIT